MVKRNLDGTVIAAYKDFCDKVKLQTEHGTVTSTIGVVQGGVTSPLTFAITIDSMLWKLNEITPTLALADDIVCVVYGHLRLTILLNTLNEECRKYQFEINKKKSAIMEIRKDRR